MGLGIRSFLVEQILTWHKIQLIQIDYGLNYLCSSLA